VDLLQHYADSLQHRPSLIAWEVLFVEVTLDARPWVACFASEEACRLRLVAELVEPNLDPRVGRKRAFEVGGAAADEPIESGRVLAAERNSVELGGCSAGSRGAHSEERRDEYCRPYHRQCLRPHADFVEVQDLELVEASRAHLLPHLLLSSWS